ncbi:hypothetical protein OPKNFCMD_5247 [Methylobacterium crusticola]|uniref:Uncharacterized protein n=1 Tax=Methylobacterium crusticola TaxID=1697972 RepID=A0ABQ4R593_9HYPH|nr:hypothetical protein [Methylobacterium crusticola]GJD52481.1 hypothetical protein OPKNFCMD_5247 [Methylobacterium crusticola]
MTKIKLEPAAPETSPVIEIAPVDIGDAHGVGATEFRPIDPRYVHLTVEEQQEMLKTGR